MFRLIVRHNGNKVIDVKFSTRSTAESLVSRYEEMGYTAEIVEE